MPKYRVEMEVKFVRVVEVEAANPREAHDAAREGKGKMVEEWAEEPHNAWFGEWPIREVEDE